MPDILGGNIPGGGKPGGGSIPGGGIPKQNREVECYTQYSK